MDLSKVYVSQRDFPENLKEVIDDILNRIYAQPNTTFQWKDAEDYLFWADLAEDEDSEQFIFIDSGSDGEHWDLNGGNSHVIGRFRAKGGERVAFADWYTAVKEKFPL